MSGTTALPTGNTIVVSDVPPDQKRVEVKSAQGETIQGVTVSTSGGVRVDNPNLGAI